MITRAFDHCGGTRQPHRKALTGHTAEEGFAAGCTVKHGVANNDVFGGVTPELNARPNGTMRPPLRPLPV